MKAAVLFDNFGPYHLARLKAAGEVVDLLAIQVRRHSLDYSWKPTALFAKEFSQVTLDPAGRCLRKRHRVERLRAILDRFRPDCVFIPGWSSHYSLQALRWCLQSGVPSVLMSESTAADQPRSRWKEHLKAWVVRMFVTALVGGRPHVEYVRDLGMPRDRIFEGYDVVDNAHFQNGTEVSRNRLPDIRQELALPNQYFLASARFVSKKNLCRLIDAYARYRAKPNKRVSRDKSWSLVILGDGPLRPELERLIESNRLAGCVSLRGFRQYPELPAYYGLASAFVHCSVSEPWGLVVNEAMASSLPVLVSERCGCAGDLVSEGQNGFTFDPTDVEQLAELLLRITRSESERKKMGQASAKLISNWSPMRFGRNFRDAAEAASNGGPGTWSSWQLGLIRLLAKR